MRTIRIKQETKIPGTNYVLEAGDRIKVEASLTRKSALEMDKDDGAVYVEWDDESGQYGVFGTESGFMYKGFGDEDDAEDWAENFAQNNRIAMESVSRKTSNRKHRKMKEGISGSIDFAIEKVLQGRGSEEKGYGHYFKDSDTGREYGILYNPRELTLQVEVPGPEGSSMTFFITQLISEPIMKRFGE